MKNPVANVIIVRRAEVRDLARVLEIHNEGKLSIWSLDDYLSVVSDESQIFLIAEVEREIIGFALARLITSEVEILNIAVDSGLRRGKIGQRLFDQLSDAAKLQGARECWLEVRESNSAARAFYEANSFEVVGRRKNYYHYPVEDAILMTLIFSDEHPKK